MDHILLLAVGTQFCLRNDLDCVGWGVKLYSLTGVSVYVVI